jgi:aerobic-type carbon monoxide dehydrogenase small subunit (CoxS/CutS family)
MARDIRLTVNGRAQSARVAPRTTLVDYLRVGLQLTGTHVGCEHGVCGACTVLVDGLAVRSCLMLAVQADGCDVRTIEGVAGEAGLHPIQEAFRQSHSFQCGFCTPGFVMTILALWPDGLPTDADVIRHAIAGNLCRCTGYQSIVEGIQLAAARLAASRDAADSAGAAT